ncbi:hypothetical protein B7982_06200 [Fibrobacter sp. UWB2]|nr:hypothetical protein B7982_06200 [Fibrobacter sp. UWB2]
MKKILLFLTICVTFANAQFYYDKHGESRGAYKDSLEYSKLVGLAKRFRGPILVKKPVDGVKPRKNLEKIPENKIQRTFNVNRDTLNKEKWLEVEKNEIVKICVDAPVVAWETSLKAIISSDLCLTFETPTLVGVETINVYFLDSDSSKKINLAVGMKYLDFKNEEVLLGFNRYSEKELQMQGFCNTEENGTIACGPKNEDPERLVSITGTYLVDKYPVTNCEFTQLMWDDSLLDYKWQNRKRASTRNGNCITQDTAANTVSLFWAMEYANVRSIREGLKPYYIFSPVEYAERESILSARQRIIKQYVLGYIQVSDDSTSNGYRLPYYNEWMMLARGGDKKNKAPWGDSSGSFEKTKKYARFKTKMVSFETEPVGQLMPNGYGLYDMFGLAQEHVLFEYDLFEGNLGFASCLKGGDYHVSLEDGFDDTVSPYWKWINYGYYEPGHPGNGAGFRLIRNIGNNAKWTKIKTVGKE